MAVAKMNKVYLIGHRDEKDKTLSVVQQAAMIEVSDIQAGDFCKEEWAELVEADQEQESLQDIEARLAEVRFARELLNKHYPAKKSMLDSLGEEKMLISPDEFASAAVDWSKVAGDVCRALRLADGRLLSLRSEETRLQNLKMQLAPWEKLSIPLEEAISTAQVCMELGVLPLAEMDSFCERMKAVSEESYFAEIYASRSEAYVFLAYPAGHAEELQEMFKEFSFSNQSFASLAGTPAENLARVEEETALLIQHREEVLLSIENQLDYRQTLNYYYDYLVMERDKKQVVSSLVCTDESFVMEGWLREKDLSQFEKSLAAVCNTVHLIKREPDPEELHPVALDNPPHVAPFELITTLYGTPHPRGIDPTFALTPFFVIFFGLCLSDAGYGLVVTALGALALWKLNLSRMARNAFWVLLACGVSTIVFGALIGDWFGGLILIEPLFFSALDDPMRMLLYALAIGVFQIFVGMGIQFYRSVRAGRTLDAIFDQLFWMLLVSGLIMFAVPGMQGVAKTLSLFSAVGLVLTQGRAQKGIIKKFFSGLLSLYNVTAFLGDILSYSRLLALGLATSVIAMAINMIAGMLGGSIIGYLAMVPVLIGGHTFNLVVNLLGSYVHSSRLQYLEFFSRFFQSGGRAFKPFQLNTSYVEVKVRSEK